MSRTCPICSVALNVSYAEDVEIDVCTNCNGVYLAHGEIKKITANSKLHAHFMSTLGSAQISPLMCPGCLSSMRLQYLQDTEIDTCAMCKGIWLDPGELQKLAGVAPSSIPDSAGGASYDPKKVTLEDEGRRMEMERKRGKTGDSPNGFIGKVVSLFRHE